MFDLGIPIITSIFYHGFTYLTIPGSSLKHERSSSKDTKHGYQESITPIISECFGRKIMLGLSRVLISVEVS